MKTKIKSLFVPSPRRRSQGRAPFSYGASIFKRMPNLRSTRTSLLALVTTGSVAAIAITTLGIFLSVELERSDILRAELTTKSDNYDSLRSDWNKKNHANSALRTIVGEAEDREEELASAEAALTTRDEELTTRSSDLDTREGAIKGAEDVAALNTFAGEGTFRVGTDVQPGTYTSEGGSNCYWARLSATGDDIIDNNLSSGPQVLTVQASDGLIETSRCSPFTKSG